MKAKIEGKIRQKEVSQREADRRAALDLAEAYRRLQLAGYPRVTEIHMHVEQCRADLQRAFDAIRTSNLQLYACCESKIEKGELSAVQRELQSLRQRLREVERSERDRATLRVRPEATVVSPERVTKHEADELATRRGLLSIWNLEKFFGWSAAELAARPSISVSAAQVPELRVALLELARDLTVMRQQWGKGVAPMPNAVVKTHLERLVTHLHDAYASTAQEPVDLDAISRHVHRIARLLASELSQHVLQQLRQLLASGYEGEATGNNETDATVSALQQYATAMTANVVAGTSPQRRADERRQLEQLRSEIAKLTENQHRLETAITDITSRTAAALAAHTRELAYVSSISGALPVQQLTVVGPTNSTPAMLVGGSLGADADLREVVDQVILLREQLLQMRAQFVTEDAFAELVRQWEQWRKERERMPIHGLVGQRMTGAPTALSGVVGTLARPPGALHQSSASDLDAYLALTDGSDRPKSQPRLDPLQIHRIQRTDDASNNNGTPLQVVAASSGSSATVVSGARAMGARGGALSKIQARAQMLRPRSGASTDTAKASSRRRGPL
ncbi:hypothetical protein PINS_up002505 [Pythium insidiosum]|nr:hypothetical protein PINS_up002505 [Pythium insidiosum]